MNPTTTTTTDPLPPPPQPHRSSFTCDRHPEDNFSGFCPSCLFERLSTLDPQSSPPSSRRPSTSSAIKSLFKIPSTAEKLTKSKSFSASKNEAFSGLFEPQRKSCDVRVRNINTNTNTNTNANATLSALFTIENEFKSSQNPINQQEQQHHQDEIRVLENPNVPDINEEEPDTEIIEEFRVLEKPNVPNINEEEEQVIRERNEEEEGEDLNLKTMKDHINIDSQPKKASVSFWSAASVFSKKWQKWRGGKQKVKKTTTGAKSAMEKPISRHFRETQSEIADYGFGRRSCDIDPRFSLDAGRISFDDPRYSFDEPRASWDGYMIGRTFPRLPPMVSLVEDAPASAVHVSRSDASIPVEEVETVNCINEIIPGGSIQTKEYYADSSSRRRKSFDRSSSIRRTAASVVAGIDESKGNTNSKVSPATIDSFNGVKNNSNPLRDDCSGAFGLKENICGNENGERKELKKSRRWNWKIWGFIQKRNGNGLNRDEAEEGYSRGSGIGIERSYSQSWQEMRGENLGYNPRMNRSNSSVSWRSSNNNGGTFSSGRKSNVETYGNGKTKGDEFDNGFYWGPLSSSRRGGAWMSKPNGSNSIARSVLRMY